MFPSLSKRLLVARVMGGGVNSCVQLELPSHIYHIPVDEFEFGSSPTAGGESDFMLGEIKTKYPAPHK